MTYSGDLTPLAALLTFITRKLRNIFLDFGIQELVGWNAFVQDRTRDNCWVVPPVYLIPRVLTCTTKGSKGTLATPTWKSAVFWPLITKAYWEYIEDHRRIPSGHALRHGRNSSSILGSSYAKGYVSFLKVNFGLTKENQCLTTGLMTHSTRCSTIESWQ